MKRWQISLGVFVAVVVFLVWWLSDHQVIERKTEGFLDTLTMGRDVGTGGRKLKVYKLNKLLAQSINIQAPFLEDESSEIDRDDVESAYAWLCDTAVETKFVIDKVESLEVDDDSARIQCVVNGLVEMKSVRSVDGLYRVLFRWGLVDDQWRLVSMDWKKLD